MIRLVAAALLLVTSACTSLRWFPTTGERTRLGETEWSVVPPAGWVMAQRNDILVVVPEGDPAGLPHLAFSSLHPKTQQHELGQVVSGRLSRTELLDFVIAFHHAASRPPVEVLRCEPVELAGVAGALVHSRFPGAEGGWRDRATACVIDGDRLVVVEFGVESEEFERYLPLFEAMLASVRGDGAGSELATGAAGS